MSANSYFWSHHHEDTAPLRLAVHQGRAIASSLDAAISRIQSAAQQAAQRGAHLILFPELFLRGYDLNEACMRRAAVHRSSPAIHRLQAIARSLSIAICCGYAERGGDGVEPDSSEYSGPMYNSAACIDADGSIAGHYRKTHLWQTLERAMFTAGADDDMQTFRLCGHPAHRFGLLICYDIEFCEPARLLALHGATVLLVLTALADNGKPDPVPLCVVPTRALENHCWLAYSNHAGRRTPDDDNDAAILSFRGLSAIIGPDGQELVRAGSEPQDCLLVADATPAAYVLPFHSTPYLCDRQPGMYRSLVSQMHSFSFQQMSTEQHGKEMQKRRQSGQTEEQPHFAAIIDINGSH